MTFALIDCDSFYCSCERVFRPALKGKPLVSLSNNDGCVISRTAEAKAMGIKMGQPWFEIKHLEEKGLMALSANMALYGDMSDRVMEIIGRFSPIQELYSIDESWIFLGGITEDLTTYGHKIRSAVLRETGIPTSIGIGITKTLSKLASHMAKKQPHWGGVCDLTQLDRYQLADAMKNIEVGEVWGVGRRIARRLGELGIYTVFDLARMKPEAARTEFSIVVGKTIQELRGIPRIELEEVPNPKKQIISSRSFGLPMTDLASLQSALSEFIALACNRLRNQNSIAASMQIFIRTSPFDKGKQYGNSRLVTPPYPTADNIVFTKHALKALETIWRPGFKYKKAGVMLMDISSAENIQGQLFPVEPEYDKRAQLMFAMDGINARYGRGSVKTGSTGFHDREHWYMRQERKSQGYTTNWNEVPIARA